MLDFTWVKLQFIISFSFNDVPDYQVFNVFFNLSAVFFIKKERKCEIFLCFILDKRLTTSELLKLKASMDDFDFDFKDSSDEYFNFNKIYEISYEA